MAIVNSLGKNLKQIKAVHAPLKLNAKEQDAYLDLACIADEDYALFNKTCDLANRIGCKSGKIIPIIIHASTDISKEKITEIAMMYCHLQLYFGFSRDLSELIPCEEMLRQFTVGHERGFLAQAMHMYDDFLRGKLKLTSNFKDWKE